MEHIFSNFLMTDREVTCKHCQWRGLLSKCKEEWISTPPESWMVLAGREGWEYSCPHCGWMVESYYTKMS